MTKAARREKLKALGPKPPVWQPFARRRWSRAFDEIMTLDEEEAMELYRKIYGADLIGELADHQQPVLKIVK